MYKDVWKKFGVKVLIVLCSVMLLGGIAVVAPKISANESDGTTEESGTPPEDGQDGVAALPDTDEETQIDDMQSDEEPDENADEMTIEQPENADISDADGEIKTDEITGANEVENGELIEPEEKEGYVDDGNIEPEVIKKEDTEDGSPVPEKNNTETNMQNGVENRATPITINNTNTFLSFDSHLNKNDVPTTIQDNKLSRTYDGNTTRACVYVYDYNDNNELELFNLGKSTDANCPYEVIVSHVRRDGKEENSEKEKNAGVVTYNISIKGGNSNFQGSVSLSYTIDPIKVSDCSVTDTNGDLLKFVVDSADGDSNIDTAAVSFVINNKTEQIKKGNESIPVGYKSNFYTVDFGSNSKLVPSESTKNAKIQLGNNYYSDKKAEIGDIANDENVFEFDYSVKWRFDTNTVRPYTKELTYNGRWQNPDIDKIMYVQGGTEIAPLTRGSDFEYTAKSDVLHGDEVSNGSNKPQFKIRGRGAYDSKELTFDYIINQRSISDDTGEWTDNDEFTFETTSNYSGNLQEGKAEVDYDKSKLGDGYKLDVALSWKDSDLPKLAVGTDYDVTFTARTANRDCGIIDMKVTGKGKFTGNFTVTYTVYKDLNDCEILLLNESIPYDPFDPIKNTPVQLGLNIRGMTGNAASELTQGTSENGNGDYYLEYVKGGITSDCVKDAGNYDIKIFPQKNSYFKCRNQGGFIAKRLVVTRVDASTCFDLSFGDNGNVKDEFSYTGAEQTAQAIKDKIRIYKKGQATLADDLIKEKDPDNILSKIQPYTVWFDGQQDNVQLKDGEQQIEYRFDSINYTGKIATLTFTLKDKVFDNTFRLVPKSDGGFITDTGFLYTGEVQIPNKKQFKVVYRNTSTNTETEVSEDAYEVIEDDTAYQNKNVNVSTNGAVLKLKVNEGNGYAAGVWELKFSILPFDLAVPGVTIRTEQIEYEGPNTTTKLVVSYKGKNISLKKDDYTIENIKLNSGASAAPGAAYGESGYPEFDLSNPGQSKEYQGTVTAIAPNVTGSLSNPIVFSIKPRDVNQADSGVNLIGEDRIGLDALGIVGNVTDSSIIPKKIKEYVMNKPGLNITYDTVSLKKGNDLNDAEGDYYMLNDDKNIIIENGGEVTVNVNFYRHFKGTMQWHFTVGDDIATGLTVYYNGKEQTNRNGNSVTLSQDIFRRYSPLEEKRNISFSAEEKAENQLSLKRNGVMLKPGIDYRVSNLNASHASTSEYSPYAEITSLGTGTYGTFKIYYRIEPKILSTTNVTVELKKQEWTYTGSQVRPESPDVVVYDNDDKEKKYPLHQGSEGETDKDYYLDYSSNIEAGSSAIIKVRAIEGGNYVTPSESKYLVNQTFKIGAYDLSIVSGSALQITVHDEDLYYNGSEQDCPLTIDMIVWDEESQDNKLVSLVEGKDYKVSYSGDRKNAMQNPKVVIEGRGNFKGIFERTFNIRKVDLAGEVPKVDVIIKSTEQDGGGIDFSYTGKPIRPHEINSVNIQYPKTIHDATPRVIEQKYYEITYESNENVGTALMKIQSKTPAGEIENYTGATQAVFQIKYNVGKDILDENGQLVASLVCHADGVDANTKRPYFNYNGKEKKFSYGFKVRTDDEITLGEGDYTEEYSGTHTDVGKESVVITGTGKNYMGKRTIEFDIVAELGDPTNKLFKCELRDGKTYEKYKNGEPVYPDIIVTYNGVELFENKDYIIDPTDISICGLTTSKDTMAYVVIKPANNASSYLKGSYKFEFPIYMDVGELKAYIQSGQTEYEYTRNDIKPVVTVQSTSGSALVVNEDYMVSYDNNREVSGRDAKVIIEGQTGRGYVGTLEVPFRIIPRNLESDQVTVSIEFNSGTDQFVYSGQPIEPKKNELKVTCKIENDTIRLNDDEYTLYYGNNINAGMGNSSNPKQGPYLIVEGTKNFRGSVDKPFTILQQNISVPKLTMKEKYSYRNGNPVIPKFTLEYNGKILKGIERPTQPVDDSFFRNCDYSYRITDNVQTGSRATVTIWGHGNYKDDAITVYFEIVKKDISEKKASEEETEDDYEEDVIATLSPEKFIYSGGQCTPDVILDYLNTNIVNLMVEPVIEYDRNINVTTEDKRAVVKIRANDNDPNYTGTRVIEFDIEARSLKNAIECYYVIGDGESATEQNIMQHDLKFDFTGTTQRPQLSRLKVFAVWRQNGEVKRVQLQESDFDIEYISDAKDEPEDQPQSYGGRVTVTLTGKGNFCDKGEFFYYIGDDISSATCTVAPSTSVFNAMAQPPRESISGVSLDKCNVVWYKGSVAEHNIVKRSQMIDAATYYVQIEGVPSKGTYAKEPRSMTYTITPRTLSSNVVVDGFKREYQYTGAQICPVAISVTDYIDGVKYKLAEGAEYTLSYSNNINIGTATITVNGTGNFKGTGTGQFLITASTISSGGSLPGNSYLEGTGQISGAKPVAPSDVKLTMDTANAMYYTGSPLYPRVSISGMTENVDYTVTYSSNTEVGIGVINIAGIGNNTGTITRYFRIIASLTKCTIGSIPTQEYTGSPIKPSVVVRCGNTILKEGTDYNVTYINNTNIGTATVMIRAASNENYTGSVTTTFKIGNDMSSFLVTGYPPSVIYDGEAKVPGVIVESGNTVLTQGTDYTVSYRNNVEVGIAEIIVTGMGRYDGTQTVNFVIEARNIEACDVSDVEDKVYTGDAYTPPVTVSDSGTVLQNGVDYTITYKNNTNPGTATIVIEPVNKNYAGTKTINFQIAGLAVEGVKASSIKHSSMTLSWARQSYASGYQICNAQSRVVETITSNKNSAKITGLAGGTKYQYKVRSYIQNTDGTRSYGAFSSVINATTKLKTPSVKIYARKAGQARVEWKAVSGATGYEVFYKGSKNADYRKVKTINKANVRVCKIKGLKKNQKCYAKVRAFKRQGSNKIYSAKSTGQNVKIK